MKAKCKTAVWPGVPLFAALLGISLGASGDSPITLKEAIEHAQYNDPWLRGSELRQQSLSLQGEVAAQLPDPMVSLSAANLPTDSFALDQEPMTQLKVGVSQAFPRGDTRALKRQQFDILSDQQIDERRNRLALAALQVSGLWLDAYRHREAIRLIEQDRNLFEYLVDVAESSYRSALGKTRQQDLVRAQLELTRLEDRLAMLRQQEEAALSQLVEWLPDMSGPRPNDQLPDLDVVPMLPAEAGDENLRAVLARHPSVAVIDKRIAAMGTSVSLAKERYKPQFSVNTSYAYREDDPRGNDRADFFSVGVSLDVPLFTAHRQDKQLQSAVAEEDIVRTDRALALRALYSRYQAASARLARLSDRKHLYEGRLLNEIHDQAEASLNAYTNDEGDFAEVVRARIAELNANIDFLNIRIDRLKTIAELNYLLAGGADQTRGES